VPINLWEAVDAKMGLNRQRIESVWIACVNALRKMALTPKGLDDRSLGAPFLTAVDRPQQQESSSSEEDAGAADRTLGKSGSGHAAVGFIVSSVLLTLIIGLLAALKSVTIFQVPHGGYEIALMLLLPSEAQDLLIPAALLVIAQFARMLRGVRGLQVSTSLAGPSCAWLLATAWRGTLLPSVMHEFPGLNQTIQDYVPIPVQSTFLVVSTILHFYVLVSFSALMLRALGVPIVRLLGTRAYPNLMFAILLPFGLALWLRWEIDLPYDSFKEVLPNWYFYLGGILFFSVALIRRRH
jgi:hypothetical protein